jgi:hypothetical protein
VNHVGKIILPHENLFDSSVVNTRGADNNINNSTTTPKESIFFPGISIGAKIKCLMKKTGDKHIVSLSL